MKKQKWLGRWGFVGHNQELYLCWEFYKSSTLTWRKRRAHTLKEKRKKKSKERSRQEEMRRGRTTPWRAFLVTPYPIVATPRGKKDHLPCWSPTFWRAFEELQRLSSTHVVACCHHHYWRLFWSSYCCCYFCCCCCCCYYQCCHCCCFWPGNRRHPNKHR